MLLLSLFWFVGALADETVSGKTAGAQHSAFAAEADASAEVAAAPVQVSRPVEGILLPWNSRGFWPYSAAGEAPSPESLVRMAVVEEARGAYITAYHNYRRVLVQYPRCKAPDVLHDVYLGMSRCLSAMGRSDEAARLLLRLTGVNEALRGDPDARELLELASAGITDDRALKSQVDARLRSWPAETPRLRPTEDVPQTRKVESRSTVGQPQPTVEQPRPGPDELAPETEPVDVSEAVFRVSASDKSARDLYERVAYYCKKGQTDAAQVYVDFLASRFPRSRYVSEARTLLARVDSRRQ